MRAVRADRPNRGTDLGTPLPKPSTWRATERLVP
jgi:hypothetical protein